MNLLALCAGYGGLELGIEQVLDGVKTVCFVEGECFAAQHLVKKMEDGSLHAAPIWSNVRTFNGEPWRGKVDIITGGFPCQPYSSAGKQLADKDPRDLWPDFVRIVGEVRPGLLFFENVPGIVKWRLNQIILDLDQLGYSCAWCVVAASDVGALHKRKRWFLFGVRNDTHPNNQGERAGGRTIRQKNRHNVSRVGESCGKGELAHTDDERLGPCCGRSSEEHSKQSERRKDNSGRSQFNDEPGFKESSNLQENVSDTYGLGWYSVKPKAWWRKFDVKGFSLNISNPDSEGIKRIRGFDGKTPEIKGPKRHFDSSDKWG
ncbi:MAG: DNA cytosine methyltransferase [Opitutae bacterium]